MGEWFKMLTINKFYLSLLYISICHRSAPEDGVIVADTNNVEITQNTTHKKPANIINGIKQSLIIDLSDETTSNTDLASTYFRWRLVRLRRNEEMLPFNPIEWNDSTGLDSWL